MLEKGKCQIRKIFEENEPLPMNSVLDKELILVIKEVEKGKSWEDGI
jgi:hypothetical protein